MKIIRVTLLFLMLTAVLPFKAITQEVLSTSIPEYSCNEIAIEEDLAAIYINQADTFADRQAKLVYKSAEYVQLLTEIQQMDTKYQLTREQNMAREKLTKALKNNSDQLTTEGTRLTRLATSFREAAEYLLIDKELGVDELQQRCESDIGNLEEEFLKSKDLVDPLVTEVDQLLTVFNQTITPDKLTPQP